MEEQALKVNIKLIGNPFDVKGNKDYYRKKDYFLTSNVAAANILNPLAPEGEDQQRLVDDPDYPSHAFLTIVSSVRISPEEPMSTPTLQTLICSAKAPALLRKYEDFNPAHY